MGLQGRAMVRAEVQRMHELSAHGLDKTTIAARTGRSRSAVRLALASEPESWPVVEPVLSAPPVGAARRSAEVRSARALLARELQSGARSLGSVLCPVDPVVASLPVVDVVRMQWSTTGRRSGPALEELGRFAVRDGVNLLLAVGHANSYTRAWVVEHGSKWARRRRAAA